MKTKTIKARRMTLLQYLDGYEIFKDAKKADKRCKAVEDSEGYPPPKTHVAVIDVSDEEALVDAAAKGLFTESSFRFAKWEDYRPEQSESDRENMDMFRRRASAVLTALGILAKKRKTRKVK